MTPKCYFHPDREAIATDSIIDLDAPSYGPQGQHLGVSYKRVPICLGCYSERTNVNTSRVELLPEGETGRQYIFRSPSRLIAELGEPIHNMKFGGRNAKQQTKNQGL